MKKIIVSIFIVFAFAAANATNVTVNNFTALIAEVNGTADTIYIDGTIVVPYNVNVYRNVVFIGINNGTLNGNNVTNIVYYGANYIEFDDLIFINGNNSNGLGSAISTGFADSLIVRNCKFINNRNPSGFGGAIYGQNFTSLFLENCEFRNNQAYVGGGIWVSGNNDYPDLPPSNLYVINCIFDSNAASMATGGLDTHSWSKVTIFNSAFTNNTSGSTDPGAICLGYNGQTNIINATIAKNHTDGGAAAIGLWGSEHLNVYNCVLTGNTTPFGTNDIANTPVNYENSVIRMYNSVYNQLGVGLTLNTNINNFNNIQPNITFVDFANNDFYLQSGSAAVNSGDENDYVTQWNLNFPQNTITTPAAHNDIDGNNRTICHIDMGAYESAFPAVFPFSDTFCENGFYDFNGQILTEAGVFYDTIVATVGCDTVRQLTLTKLDVSRYEYRDTSYKCEWYYFGNDSINETGIYIDTLTARNGCDSIVTLNLLVRPREFGDTLSICIDNLPATAYDTTFSATSVSGTYIIHHRCAVITFLLNVEPRPQVSPPDIPQICADDGSFTLTFAQSNEPNTKQPTNYEIIFDNNAVLAGFENQSGEFDDSGEVVVQMPEKVYPDYYNCQITFFDNINNCASQTLDIRFPVLYPDTVMEQKWDDVIALLNEYYNGGFRYAAYQWYRNGQMLTGEDYSYIYLAGKTLIIGDYYSVLFTREDGSQMFSCPFFPHEPRPLVSDIPIVIDGNIRIMSPRKNALVRLITTTGIVLQTQRMREMYLEMPAPQQTGIYLLEILSEKLEREIFKIIVK